MKVLVLGATGMLGYSLFSNLNDYDELTVFGTTRSIKGKERFFDGSEHLLFQGVDVNEWYSIQDVILNTNPDIVINCIGLIKQYEISKQHICAIEINSLLPHRLADICDQHGAKLIHFSTDCVFDGAKGGYKEEQQPNALDLYGRSKCLGEVDYGRHVTLRTSIIGHELDSSVSLVDWFLSQTEEVKGFTEAIFSGLPTCYIAKLVAETILEYSDLNGLYHLSVQPIDKYSLLSLVAEVYRKDIAISKSSDLVIDRSLDSSRFQALTGFVPPSWQELIEFMHKDYLKRYK